jgi:hypothetical protein
MQNINMEPAKILVIIGNSFNKISLRYTFVLHLTDSGLLFKKDNHSISIQLI